MKRTSARHGYAMMMVLVFLVLMLSLGSLTYRQIGSALRIESVRSRNTARDEGSLQALARSLSLLETGLPPSNPFVCGVTIDTSSGPSSLTVTFESDEDTIWSVHVAPTGPGDSPEPMPTSFASPDP